MSEAIVPQTEYEKALEQVHKYEKRQDQLKKVEQEISSRLADYGTFKFKIDKKSGEIIFSGFHNLKQKLLIGVAKCDKSDVFNANIGKLIAIRKSEHQHCDDLYELVEQKNEIKFTTFTSDGVNLGKHFKYGGTVGRW